MGTEHNIRTTWVGRIENLQTDLDYEERRLNIQYNRAKTAKDKSDINDKIIKVKSDREILSIGTLALIRASFESACSGKLISDSERKLNSELGKNKDCFEADLISPEEYTRMNMEATQEYASRSSSILVYLDRQKRIAMESIAKINRIGESKKGRHLISPGNDPIKVAHTILTQYSIMANTYEQTLNAQLDKGYLPQILQQENFSHYDITIKAQDAAKHSAEAIKSLTPEEKKMSRISLDEAVETYSHDATIRVVAAIPAKYSKDMKPIEKWMDFINDENGKMFRKKVTAYEMINEENAGPGKLYILYPEWMSVTEGCTPMHTGKIEDKTGFVGSGSGFNNINYSVSSPLKMLGYDTDDPASMPDTQREAIFRHGYDLNLFKPTQVIHYCNLRANVSRNPGDTDFWRNEGIRAGRVGAERSSSVVVPKDIVVSR